MLGHSGKAACVIVRRAMVVTMGEAEIGKGPADLYPAERVAKGRATLDHRAQRGTRSGMEGGSRKMRGQVVPRTGNVERKLSFSPLVLQLIGSVQRASLVSFLSASRPFFP